MDKQQTRKNSAPPTLIIQLTIFTLLTLLNLVLFLNTPTHIKTGSQLLKNNHFSQGKAHWQTSYSNEKGEIAIFPNLVSIKTYNTLATIKLAQMIDTKSLQSNTLLLSASVKSDDISQGNFRWNTGKILLIQMIQDKMIQDKMNWHLSQSLVSISGTTPWQTYSKIFTISPKTDYLVIRVEINNATGLLAAKNLKLYNAIPNPRYNPLRILLFCTWGAFCVLLFFPYLKTSPPILKLIIVCVSFALIGGITMNADFKNTLRSNIYKKIEYASKLLHQAPEGNSIASDRHHNQNIKEAPLFLTTLSQKQKTLDVTKFAHILLFMILGYLFIQNGAKPIIIVVKDIIFLSCITEMLQLFIDGRSALIGDVFIDIIGGITGICLALIARRVLTFTPTSHL